MRLLDAYKIKHKLYEYRIRAHWAELMGPSIARYTSKMEVYDGVLTIYLNSAPLRNELAYAKDKIIKTINEHLGERYIKEVKLL